MPATTHAKPARGQCSHKRYRLTCEDYDVLWERAEGRCEICGREPQDTTAGTLFVDHDWSLGWWAVRGLLCNGCNARSALDDPRATTTARVERYLTRPWWAEAVEGKALTAISGEPAIGGRIIVAPQGWVFVREPHGAWRCETAGYRKGLLTWRKLLSDFGPFAISETTSHAAK